MTDAMAINNVFWTIQGEGYYAGTRALFVRMPHCNLTCSWCDTSFDTSRIWTKEELKEIALSEDSRFAVITGGEPMLHRHTRKVVETLKELGFYIAAETNGTMKPPCEFDWITCSPKREAEYKIHDDLYEKVSEFKYVVDSDFPFAVLDRHKNETSKRLSLSPEFGNFKQSVAAICEYVKNDPRWKISLQTHKWMGIP